MKTTLRNILVMGMMGMAFCLPGLAHANMGGGIKGGHEKHEKMEQRIQKVFDQLSLSDEQKKLLAENKAKHKTSRGAFSKVMKESMKAMGEALKAKDVDMNKVNALQNQLKAAHAQMADERLNAILEVRKILTQEQFIKFSSLMEEKRSKWSKD